MEQKLIEAIKLALKESGEDEFNNFGECQPPTRSPYLAEIEKMERVVKSAREATDKEREKWKKAIAKGELFEHHEVDIIYGMVSVERR